MHFFLGALRVNWSVMLESYKTLLGVVENRGSRAAKAIKKEYVEQYCVDEIGTNILVVK